jgi:hypothetical protein
LTTLGEINQHKICLKKKVLELNVSILPEKRHNKTGWLNKPTLFGKERALMTNAGFKKFKRETLWAKCAATATKLNNLPVRTSKKKNPYELFYGKENPIKKHLKIFGEIGIVTKSNTSKIISERGVPSKFLGYAKDHAPNVYCMLKLDTNNVIITRDIV